MLPHASSRGRVERVTQPKPNARIQLEIVYEDARIAIANKSPGLVSEPGKSHRADSLLNAMIARYGGKMLQLGERRDYGLLHRLDRQTSGCVACALDPEAYAIQHIVELAAWWRDRINARATRSVETELPCVERERAVFGF